MMTFKEIDQRINHFHKELDFSASLLKNRNISKEINVEISDNKKMQIEFFSFVTSSYIDLLCTYRNLKRSKSDWEKFYNIKIAYLFIYETINNYHKYKGEVYKTVTKEEEEIYKKFFNMFNQELTEFKITYDYDNVMAKVRNKSSAHYDKDFLTYYSSYEIIKNPQANEIIRDFLYFINPLHYFTFGLLNGEVDEFLFVNSWLI